MPPVRPTVTLYKNANKVARADTKTISTLAITAAKPRTRDSSSDVSRSKPPVPNTSSIVRDTASRAPVESRVQNTKPNATTITMPIASDSKNAAFATDQGSSRVTYTRARRGSGRFLRHFSGGGSELVAAGGASAVGSTGHPAAPADSTATGGCWPRRRARCPAGWLTPSHPPGSPPLLRRTLRAQSHPAHHRRCRPHSPSRRSVPRRQPSPHHPAASS